MTVALNEFSFQTLPGQLHCPSLPRRDVPSRASEELEARQRTEASVRLPSDRKLLYNYDKDLNRVVVKIVDPKTDKVVEEIPSVDMQKFIACFTKQIGLLCDICV